MKKFKKTIVIALSFVFALSPAFAIPANAQWVDIVQATKEMGLDTLAWELVNRTIERMAASTVNWINTGFKGSPAYVTDPEAYFKDLGDKAAGEFIFRNRALDELCGPISGKIKLALQRAYIREPQWRCTLTDVWGNMEDFMNDFDKGGWDKFFELTQKQQNNPIGAFIQAEAELNQRLATSLDVKKDELNWGRGFMSYKQCTQRPMSGPLQPGQERPTVEVCETVTPGSVIENKLNEALGSGSNRLQAADEINEIVSALLNQLISQAVGGIGKGLRGLSNPGSAGDKSVTQQLSTNTITTGYFEETPDTSVLDEKIPGSTISPADNDCSSFSPDDIAKMATDKIEADPLLTSDNLEQVIRDLDCEPAGIN